MKLLAFDASTQVCSVALLNGAELTERVALGTNQHTEKLLPMAQALLQYAGVTPKQLDAIAFGCGPGAFTGMRIACGTAQGIAFGLNLPVVPISSLLALARASGRTQVIAALDARMDEIYHAAYILEHAGWRCVSAPRLCAPHAAPALSGDGWFGAGSAFAAYGDALRERYGAQLSGGDGALEPRAAHIANLAVAAYQRGEHVPAELAAPIYLRDKVALTSVEQASFRSERTGA